MTSNAGAIYTVLQYTKFNWLYKNVEPIKVRVILFVRIDVSYSEAFSSNYFNLQIQCLNTNVCGKTGRLLLPKTDRQMFKPCS